MIRMWTLLVFACLASTVVGQDAERKVKVDDFEGELAGWSALKLDGGGIAEDGDAKLALVKEAAHVKSGKGALSYAYEVVPGSLRLLALQRELALEGMKSLRLFVKCSAATAVVVSLNERGGASYQCSVTCAAGAWQEIAVNLDELAVDDPAKDDNGRLDPGEVVSLHVLDIAGFVSTILPELKGPRTLELDEVAFSTRAVPATTGPAQVTKVVPAYRVDSFETAVIRWIPISVDFADGPKFGLFQVLASIDASAPPAGGKQSLQFTYPRHATKVHGLMRGVEKVDLSSARSVDLWMKTSADGTYILNLEEKDGSRYNVKLELHSADGWKSFSFQLADFVLADDSQDENAKLDPGQIKQVLIADATGLLGGAAADSATLWIDEVLFIQE